MTRGPQEVLREVFGYPEFRPHQCEAVEAVCAGRSVRRHCANFCVCYTF